MPGRTPCPHCGKSLKLPDVVAGKAIRCPGCKQTFPAPCPSSGEGVPEVLAVAAAENRVEESPARQERPAAAAASPRTSRSGNGLALGLALGLLAVVLVVCGGLGTLGFFIGRAVLNSVHIGPQTAPVVNAPPPPQPVPNPPPNPNPPQPNPAPNPQPIPRPQPTPAPAREELKRVGDQLTVQAGGTRMVRTMPDGKRIAAVGEDGVVTVLELPRFGADPMAYPLGQTFPAEQEPIRNLAFHPSSQMAVVAGDHVHVYNDFTGKLKATLTYKEPVAAVFNPSGTLLAIAVRKPGDQGSEVHLWDTWHKRAKGKALTLAGKVSDMAWPAGSYDLAVAVDDEVHFYHTPESDWRYKHSFATRQGSVACLAFTQHGQSLVTVGGDRTIKLWTQKDGKLLRTYEGAVNPVGRPAFTPDGSHLAVLGGPGEDKVYLWRTGTTEPIDTLSLAPARGGNVDFLRDNRTLVVSLRNGPIRFWTIPDGGGPRRRGPR